MADITITAANVQEGSSAVTESGTLGATATAGQVVYLDTSAGTWKLADNNSATAAVRAPGGILLNGGSSGQPCKVLKKGLITIGATLTAGVAYYLSDTPGGICPVADLASGEYPTFLGIATSTAILNVNITSAGVAL